MTIKSIIVTREDFERLVALLKGALLAVDADRGVIRELASDLEHARVVDSAAVPIDVITMNSTVKLTDLDTDEAQIYTLVYPEVANSIAGYWSILTPIGAALLGCRVGDRVAGSIPWIMSNMQIHEVIFQPERDERYEFAT